ncbi:DUF3626 domain-containing protein [Paenibacillus nanensis]|uniref:DUF3626 domain-containing protein n=1 Tax=Paenibacillus nanensis TaxID=393251 RepID=A0A3A1UQQ3_9BACL|nr:DUF3626 domain-containing protein [Paenibacillus nanensis]RIX48597.1 DUF3626 domain-containing protein [Paenibacillus nanensis]
MSTKRELTTAQLQALEHVAQYAKSRRSEARQSLEDIFGMSNIGWETFENAAAKFKHNACVALHFHPDRPAAGKRSVAQALLEDGVYESQFVTRISNGSVTAYSGGARDLWEERLFGGAYQQEGVPDSDRPKYGALDFMLHPDGPAPRFGSCYFLLKPEVSSRCTFTYLDSHQDPKQRGTLAEFDDVLAALFTDAFILEYAIGERDLTPPRLIRRLQDCTDQPLGNLSDRNAGRNLNHYIEAQVHGPVSLREDADLLVADPSFKGTEIGETLQQLCSKYSIKLHWHMGFALRADEVPADFRGPGMPSLGRRIACGGFIDAAAIGAAVVDLRRDPDAWADRGSVDEVLQELKYMWHVLVRFGGPFGGGNTRSNS